MRESENKCGIKNENCMRKAERTEVKNVCLINVYLRIKYIFDYVRFLWSLGSVAEETFRRAHVFSRFPSNFITKKNFFSLNLSQFQLK